MSPTTSNQHPDSEQADGQLVAAVLSGDREQFGGLVGRYHAALQRVAASRLGRQDWAEDVVQETLLSAFKSLHTYDSRFSFRTWLWTILLNQCHRHFRRRSRGSASGDLPEAGRDQPAGARAAGGSQCTGDTPADILLARERDELLQRLLNELPENQADALRLRFFGGLKFREIAETMDCSLSTAKNRVRWGLSKMAKRLGADASGSKRSTAESCHETPDDL